MVLSCDVESEMKNAIAYLTASLQSELVESTTHKTLTISGWNDNCVTRQAIAHYLIGLRASAIDAALNIKSQLEDTNEDIEELRKNVISIIGSSDDELSLDQKQDERNTWISEGLWHLCMEIASKRKEFHPIGKVIAIDYPHIASKDHGLDVVVLYKNKELLGISIIETKAYKLRPNKAIKKAIEFFREVDQGKYDLRIRQSVQIMRTALPEDLQKIVTGSFWKRQRAYIPNPHYDACCKVDLSKNRPTFNGLFPGNLNIIVMPHAIIGFDVFFNQISDEMRSIIRSYK